MEDIYVILLVFACIIFLTPCLVWIYKEKLKPAIAKFLRSFKIVNADEVQS